MNIFRTIMFCGNKLYAFKKFYNYRLSYEQKEFSLNEYN